MVRYPNLKNKYRFLLNKINLYDLKLKMLLFIYNKIYLFMRNSLQRHN
jgi:hypothetical protein